jgi:tetratricopeptide (TPR) repeat protein
MGKAQRRKRQVEPAREIERPSPPAARPAAPRPAPPRPAAVRAARAGSLPLAAALPALVFLAAGVAVYANSFSIPFLFDDHFEILRNPDVKKVEPVFSYLTRARGIPTWSFALNYQWGGEDVWGYHPLNLAVHLASALVIYALVLTTLRLPTLDGRYAGREHLLAGLTALVFTVHPLQTMAVSYIVQRTESIAAFFYFLSLLFFARGEIASGGRRAAFYAGMAAAGFLGVVSKQTVVTLPATLLAYRFCLVGRKAQGPSWRRAVWLLALLVPAAYALYLSRAYLLSLEPTTSDGIPRSWIFIPTAGFGLEGVTPWQYLITQFGVVLWYLRLYLLPTSQCFDYGWPLADSLWRIDVLLPLAALLLLVGLAVAVRRRHPVVTFAIAWFFVTLLPSSSIVPLRDAAFEHRMYLPLFGLALLTVVGGFDLCGWVAERAGLSRPHVSKAAAAVVLVWIALLATLTVRRNEVYGDPLRLARDSAEKAPGNWRPNYEVAFELMRQQRVEEAIAPLERAVQLAPESGSPRIQLGEIYTRYGRYDEAIELLRPATRVEEESVRAAAHRQLGLVYLAKQDRMNAIAEFEEVVKLKPTWISSQQQLAQLYVDAGLWYSAANRFNRLFALKPQQPANLVARAAEVNYRAGVSFLHIGKTRAAIKMLIWALKYRPEAKESRHFLAISYAADAQWEKAEETIAALAADLPEDGLVQENLRLIRARQTPMEPGTPLGQSS